MVASLQWGSTQPRYVAYCIEHGATNADEMLARDRITYPGGCMAGYIVWISRKWSVWEAANSRTSNDYKTRGDHVSFNHWLAADVTVPEKPAPASPSLSFGGSDQ
jgi:hypothetical protein